MIIVLMGVSGVGKTTIGTLLAADLNIPFYDGDDFHPPDNIAKMRQGLPLDDRDRGSWLETLHDLMQTLNDAQQSAVLACSALKASYRHRLQGDLTNVRFVFLQGNYELIRQRLQQRQHHFMSADLLKSQFETLEQPEGVLAIEVKEAPAAIVQTIKTALGYPNG
ncbi:MAG: gluconokinase [Leptolyngbyaceae cyanobacterium bins.349]|nr:gluconokinase [Leptolyngbyaceae cyanobacterium bins.349]